MQVVTQEIIKKEQEEIDKINKQLQMRAEKFGSEFTPIALADYKLYKIKKASETGKMQYLQSILLEDIQDLQERQKRIRERTQKFFPNIKVETDANKFFNQRQDPDFTEDNTKIRYNAWHLFGVDYMSNQKIRNYFSINPHFKIQWINDSSCNIVFETKQAAQQAVRPLVQGDSMKDEQQIWYQLQEYEVDGVKRRLFCRLATNKDVKVQTTTGKDSKYYRWEQNKKSIDHYVKKRAYQYINKEKRIKKENVTKVNKEGTKKEQQEENSSSGVENSDEKQMQPQNQ